MIILLNLIILTTLCVLAVKIITANGMALEKIGVYAQKKVEEEKKKIWDVLCYCPWCMPTLYSLAGFIFAFGIGVLRHFSWQLLFYYPLCVFGSSLTSGLIWTAYLTMATKRSYYENCQKYYYHETKRLKKETDPK